MAFNWTCRHAASICRAAVAARRLTYSLGVFISLDIARRVPMAKAPEFDLEAAHRYFAAHCFNTAWDLIEKKNRTPEDDRMMVALNQASLFH